MNRSPWLLSLLALAAACDEGGPLSCPLDFTGPVSSAYGDPRLDALFEATGAFSVATAETDAEMRDACNAIAMDLGAATSTDTAVACENAATAIEDVLTTTEATLLVDIVPAECTVEADAYVDCVAECDASFDVMAEPPRCEGGTLSGTCEGSCSGSCTVEGDVSCEGSCTGTCSGECSALVEGSCDGTCVGQCDGECSATAADGSCEGVCTGTCSGSCEGTLEGECSGTCNGSCAGSCEADVSGSCEGTCTGSCDVEWIAPTCEGGQLDVDADADCEAACEADASFDAECTPPQIVVTYDGASAVELEELVATLRANYPHILAAGRKAALMVQSTIDLAASLDDAASAAADAGLQAAACLGSAIEAQLDAAARIEVTFEASVTVSGSVSASAG